MIDRNTFMPVSSCNFSISQSCGMWQQNNAYKIMQVHASQELQIKFTLNFRKEKKVTSLTLTVSWLLVPNRLGLVFQKLLMS